MLSVDGADTIKPEELLPQHGSTDCELIAISKTRVQDWKWAKGVLLEWELDEHPSANAFDDVYEFYNVLWIRWLDGIAYRRGIGRVSKEIWKGLESEELDINLG